MDPFLVEQICAQTDTLPRDMRRLVGFLDDYLQACEAELFGPVSVLGRMKELWGYLHAVLRQGDRVWNAVKICRTVDEYRRVVDQTFAAFPGFAEEAALSGIEGEENAQRSTFKAE